MLYCKLVLTNVPMDKNNIKLRSNDTIYDAVSTSSESVEEILWCDHSNKTSSKYIGITIKLNKTTHDQTLTKSNYHFLENKQQKTTQK